MHAAQAGQEAQPAARRSGINPVLTDKAKAAGLREPAALFMLPCFLHGRFLLSARKRMRKAPRIRLTCGMRRSISPLKRSCGVARGGTSPRPFLSGAAASELRRQAQASGVNPAGWSMESG